MTTIADLDALIDELTVEVALADLVCDAGSELGLIVAAYRRWQVRGYRV